MIWEQCKGVQHIRPISGELYRIVESQEQVATRSYVDSLDEQALLEELLDDTKPPYPDGSDGLHYLLKTPFRYPPLDWGSRFGRRHESSIFYGGLDEDAVLAEAAYYRFVFWYSMSGEPVKDSINTEHTLFSVGYDVDRGVQLQMAPFDEHLKALTHPTDYSAPQKLGTSMREADLQAFEYNSARDPQSGICIGLFTPEAFAGSQPNRGQQWQCELTATKALFKAVGNSEVIKFNLSDFVQNGELPMPA